MNGMARATSTKCGWHSSHVMEGAWALSCQRTLSWTAGQPSTPVLATKASAGRWLWELVEEKKGSLGCRSGRLRRGLGAALDASVSAGKEKGWVSWAGKPCWCLSNSPVLGWPGLGESHVHAASLLRPGLGPQDSGYHTGLRAGRADLEK